MNVFLFCVLHVLVIETSGCQNNKPSIFLVATMEIDSAKKERAKQQAIVKKKHQEGCLAPNYKKIATAKKRAVEMRKKN